VNGSFVITWSGGGTLQWANTPAGPWTDNPAATSPFADPINTAAPRFYRIIVR
jgi:hypothetical protein